MARGFSEAIDAFRNRRGKAWVDAIEMYNILRGIGASRLELNTLMGIAAAESAFDWNARGTIGEVGAWQIEKDDATAEAQAGNALRALRETIDDMNEARNPPLVDVITQDVHDNMKIYRAVWQRGAKKKDSTKRWLTTVRGQLNAIAGGLISAGLNRKEAEAQAARQMTKDGTDKFGAEAFIKWSAAAEGSNRQALENGQKAFIRFMDAVKWSPSTYTAGKAGLPTGADVTGEEIGIATGEALKAPGVWLKDAVKWGFENIREGGKELIYQTTRTVLPPALLVLGGYMLYKAISKAATKGSP